jgi:polyketide biosynthesis acyl carrier protein
LSVILELKGHKFFDEDQLVNLCVNLVNRAEIVTMIMESLSLQIPMIELFGVKNIGELADISYSKIKSKVKSSSVALEFVPR